MIFRKAGYGLAGYPLGHSFSPLLHNSAFSRLNIAGKYKLFSRAPAQIDNFLAGLNKTKTIKGLNITVPYKEKVLSFLDYKSEEVEKVGACNTLVVSRDNLIKGFNTDIFGFTKHLEEIFAIKGKKVILFGAGGAAKAVAFSLIQAGAGELAIYDIDFQKTSDLTGLCLKFKGNNQEIKVYPVRGQPEALIKEKDLLINATPVGLDKTDKPLIASNFLHSRLLVYDLIYNPAETGLLLEAKKAGAGVSNGLRMLIYQAAKSFIHFTGSQAGVEAVAEIMKEAVKREGINV